MIYPVKHPKQTSWKIIYGNYQGMEKHAVNLLSREMGKRLIREEGAYKLYILPCEQEGEEIKQNAVVVKLYEESETVRRFVTQAEVNENDYIVKVVENPVNSDCVLIVITAKTAQNLFYGASAFLRAYPTDCAPLHGGLKIPQWIYDYKMQTYTLKEKAKIATRSVFTWGHPINDYRAYIRNLASLRLNQLILWNDYLPLNAKEVVDYAHEFGLQVLWGYSWGWDERRVNGKLDLSQLPKIKEKVLRSYEEKFKDTGADGIYFQSFTETAEQTVDGVPIARLVTDFVNDTVASFYEKYPDIKIQFGLHATSVKAHLDELARIDKRVEIVWEDCGAFPFDYNPVVTDEKKFEETLELTRKIINLRGDAPLGLVMKGFMTLDWETFVSQNGPFVMGENAKEIIKADAELRKPIWQMFEAGWITYGDYALRLIREAQRLTNGKINICMAGLFEGEISLPLAMCAEMMFDPERDFKTVLYKVSAQSAVR